MGSSQGIWGSIPRKGVGLTKGRVGAPEGEEFFPKLILPLFFSHTTGGDNFGGDTRGLPRFGENFQGALGHYWCHAKAGRLGVNQFLLGPPEKDILWEEFFRRNSSFGGAFSRIGISTASPAQVGAFGEFQP